MSPSPGTSTPLQCLAGGTSQIRRNEQWAGEGAGEAPQRAGSQPKEGCTGHGLRTQFPRPCSGGPRKAERSFFQDEFPTGPRRPDLPRGSRDFRRPPSAPLSSGCSDQVRDARRLPCTQLSPTWDPQSWPASRYPLLSFGFPTLLLLLLLFHLFLLLLLCRGRSNLAPSLPYPVPPFSLSPNISRLREIGPCIEKTLCMGSPAWAGVGGDSQRPQRFRGDGRGWGAPQFSAPLQPRLGWPCVHSLRGVKA